MCFFRNLHPCLLEKLVLSALYGALSSTKDCSLNLLVLTIHRNIHSHTPYCHLPKLVEKPLQFVGCLSRFFVTLEYCSCKKAYLGRRRMKKINISLKIKCFRQKDKQTTNHTFGKSNQQLHLLHSYIVT